MMETLDIPEYPLGSIENRLLSVRKGQQALISKKRGDFWENKMEVTVELVTVGYKEDSIDINKKNILSYSFPIILDDW